MQAPTSLTHRATERVSSAASSAKAVTENTYVRATAVVLLVSYASLGYNNLKEEEGELPPALTEFAAKPAVAINEFSAKIADRYRRWQAKRQVARRRALANSRPASEKMEERQRMENMVSENIVKRDARARILA